LKKVKFCVAPIHPPPSSRPCDPFHLSISFVNHCVIEELYDCKKKPNSKPQKGWKKPLEGKLMINMDAAFNIDSGKEVTWVVIRDFAGYCVAADQNIFTLCG
jgi:hypothetical protein